MKRLLSLLIGLALPLLLAGATERPHLAGLSHVALFVQDVEKSRVFYKNLLGFDEPFSTTNKDGTLHLTWIKINDRQSIELFPEKEPASDRLNHIAIETDDANAMREYLAGKGIHVPTNTPVGKIGNANFMIQDADGHNVEIVQYLPKGWTRRERGKFLPDTRISRRMMHAGILVGDLDAALKFYGEVLGAKEFWRGGADPNVLSWVNVRLPESEDYLEFMLYADLPEPTQRGRAHHICLEVADVDAAKKILEARVSGAHYTKALEIKTGVNRKRQLNLWDPDGTRIELMEPRTVDGIAAVSSKAPAPK